MKVLLLPLLCCLLAGCATDPNRTAESQAPPPASEDKAKPVPSGPPPTYSSSNLSFTLPKSWAVLDFSGGNRAKKIEEVQKKWPELRDNLESVAKSAADDPIKFYAFDVENTKDELTCNLNLIEMPVPPGATLEQVLDANETDYKKMATKPLTREKVKVKGGEFTRYALGFQVPIPSAKPLDMEGHAYVTLHRGNQIILTFTSPPDQAQRFFADARKAIDTVELK
jgi:hypothetical protein